MGHPKYSATRFKFHLGLSISCLVFIIGASNVNSQLAEIHDQHPHASIVKFNEPRREEDPFILGSVSGTIFPAAHNPEHFTWTSAESLEKEQEQHRRELEYLRKVKAHMKDGKVSPAFDRDIPPIEAPAPKKDDESNEEIERERQPFRNGGLEYSPSVSLVPLNIQRVREDDVITVDPLAPNSLTSLTSLANQIQNQNQALNLLNLNPLLQESRIQAYRSYRRHPFVPIPHEIRYREDIRRRHITRLDNEEDSNELIQNFHQNLNKQQFLSPSQRSRGQVNGNVRGGRSKVKVNRPRDNMNVNMNPPANPQHVMELKEMYKYRNGGQESHYANYFNYDNGRRMDRVSVSAESYPHKNQQQQQQSWSNYQNQEVDPVMVNLDVLLNSKNTKGRDPGHRHYVNKEAVRVKYPGDSGSYNNDNSNLNYDSYKVNSIGEFDRDHDRDLDLDLNRPKPKYQYQYKNQRQNSPFPNLGKALARNFGVKNVKNLCGSQFGRLCPQKTNKGQRVKNRGQPPMYNNRRRKLHPY